MSLFPESLNYSLPWIGERDPMEDVALFLVLVSFPVDGILDLVQGMFTWTFVFLR